MRCLGIDIGSSSIKGGVLNLATGKVEQLAKEPFPEPVAGLPSGFHEVEPADVVVRTRSVIRQLLDFAPEARQVHFCSQMGGILLLDADRQPVTNYLSWRDQRTLETVALNSKATVLEEIRSRLSDQIFTELGKELKPGSATALLHWLARRKALPAGTTPITIGDFVISQLCNAEPLMHRTHGIGMVNLLNQDWHHAAFDALDLQGLQWPGFAEDNLPVGVLHAEGRALQCFAAIGDQQAALFGIDLQQNELSINASTGSQVSRITSTFQPADCQTRCWFGGRFLNTITHIPAGRSLTVIESLLTELARSAGLNFDNSWQLIARAAENATGNGLKCDLSFFSGAMGDNGHISGITTENLTVGNLFQAAFEFMADSYLICSQRLSPQPQWDRLAVSGGLVQAFSPLRTKLQARFPWPMREVAEQEETLTGLLRMAARQTT